MIPTEAVPIDEVPFFCPAGWGRGAYWSDWSDQSLGSGGVLGEFDPGGVGLNDGFRLPERQIGQLHGLAFPVRSGIWISSRWGEMLGSMCLAWKDLQSGIKALLGTF